MRKKVNLRGAMRSYLRWPLLMTILLIAMNIHMLYLNRRTGIIMGAYVILYIILAGIIYYGYQRSLGQSMVSYAMDFGKVQKQILKDLIIPFALLDEEGRVLWGNDEFYELTMSKKAARRSITNVFPDITRERIPKEALDEEIFLEFEEKNYKAVLRRLYAEDFDWDMEEEEKPDLDQLTDLDNLIALFLYDETEVIQVNRIRKEETALIGLLYIDNYDEALESIDEVRRSLLTALVERKINKYMQGIEAVVKKLEKDKFLFVFQQKWLPEMQNTRFSILDEVRAVNIGNEMSVTISIGIGAGAKTPAERYENARKAIDLALGRGGDQVAFKDGDRLQYFGGKSLQIERNTRVKARVKAHALKELIEGKEKVVVMGHSIGDPDSFGASVGIFRIATSLNRKPHIVINDISTSVRPLYDRLSKLPEYEDNAFINSEQAMDIVDENTVLVVVDVNRPNYTECPELLERTKTIVVLDHHRQSSTVIANAVLSYVDSIASSASEMVAEISQYIDGDVRLKQMEAEALYAGMLIDTNYFMNNTGSRTFEAAAFLRKHGVDIARIRKTFRTDINEYKAKAEAIQHTELFQDVYAITESRAEGIESPTILGAKIANELLDIKGVQASFVLTSYNDKIYISARSIDELNVQVVMEKLGGGGHMNVAGAQLEGLDAEEVRAIIRTTIIRMKEEGEI